MRLQIIAMPAGEAPAEVRQAWVGLVLPLASEASEGPVEVTGHGVLSRRPKVSPFRWLWRQLFGRPTASVQYSVPADEAMAILAEVESDAARWWQDHAPYLFVVGDRFGFAAEVCELVE